MGSSSSKIARGTKGLPRKYPTKPTLPSSMPKSSIKSTTTSQLPPSFERKITIFSSPPPLIPPPFPPAPPPYPLPLSVPATSLTMGGGVGFSL